MSLSFPYGQRAHCIMMNFTFAVFLLKSIVSNIHHLGELSNYPNPVMLHDSFLATVRKYRKHFLTSRTGSTLSSEGVPLGTRSGHPRNAAAYSDNLERWTLVSVPGRTKCSPTSRDCAGPSLSASTWRLQPWVLSISQITFTSWTHNVCHSGLQPSFQVRR